MSEQNNGERVAEGALLGLCIGLGHEAIRVGKKGLTDGALSGAVLGAVVRGALIVSDKAGLTKQVNKAKDKILRR